MPVQPVGQPQSVAPSLEAAEKALKKAGLAPGDSAYKAGSLVEEALWSEVGDGKLTPDGKGGYTSSSTVADWLFIPRRSGPPQVMGKPVKNEPSLSLKETATQPGEQALDLNNNLGQNKNLGQTVDELNEEGV